MSKHSVIQTISDAIEPYVGKLMAKSSIEAHLKRLGINGESTLSSKSVEQLLDQIALGLNVFIGREKTDAVISQVRARVKGVPA
jgi:hypothetical protein